MKVFTLLISIAVFFLAPQSCTFVNQETAAGIDTGADQQTSGAPVQTAGLIQAAAHPFFGPATEEEIKANSVYGYVIVKAAQDFPAESFNQVGAEIIDHFTLGNYRYFYLYRSRQVLELTAILNRTAGIISAIPDQKMEPAAAITYPAGLNDPCLDSAQYAAHLTQLDKALINFGIGENIIYAAVIDSGLNPFHEEFQGVYDHGFSMFTKNANKEYTFVSDSRNPVPLDNTNWDANYGEGHGTHVAGIMAGLGNNGKGVTGFCPGNVKLIVYKCFANNPDGSSVEKSGSSWAIFGSLKHLADWKRAREITQTIVVNMSLTGRYCDLFAVDMLNYSLENSVVIVAAAGNNGTRINTYPAAFPGVIAVGATDGRDQIAPFPNRGAHLSVTAPGKEIISAGNREKNQYVFMGGTSMSAPAVTGLIAYMLTFDPLLTPGEIRTLIEQNADDLGKPGFDEDYGYGRINVYRTIKAVVEHTLGCTTIESAYSQYRLIAEVTNNSQHYDNGSLSFPGSVINQAVYLYDMNGSFITCNATTGNGKAVFAFLPRARYILDTNYYNRALSNQAPSRLGVDFTNPGSDCIINFEFDVPFYYFQVLPNDKNQHIGKVSDAYTFSNLYDAGGRLLVKENLDSITTLYYPLETGQSYYLSVSPCYATSAQAGEYRTDGDYSLYVSTSRLAGTAGAAALLGNPLFDSYEPNDSFATATTIHCNRVYHSFLSAGIPDLSPGIDLVDYFKLTL